MLDRSLPMATKASCFGKYWQASVPVTSTSVIKVPSTVCTAITFLRNNKRNADIYWWLKTSRVEELRQQFPMVIESAGP